jgi:hypothetical protein
MASLIIAMIRSSWYAHISALIAIAFGGGSVWMWGSQTSNLPSPRSTRAASSGAIRMVVFISPPRPRAWQMGLTHRDD